MVSGARWYRGLRRTRECMPNRSWRRPDGKGPWCDSTRSSVRSTRLSWPRCRADIGRDADDSGVGCDVGFKVEGHGRVRVTEEVDPAAVRRRPLVVLDAFLGEREAVLLAVVGLGHQVGYPVR